MKHDNKGVISVEASISLTIFIFAFLAITSLTTFVRAESKVQYALNQTAKEFSEYSYIYSKAQEVLGIDGSGNSTEEVDKLVNNLNDFNHMISKATITASQIGSASGKDILETIKSQVNGAYTDAKDIYDSGETLYNQLQSYADNPTVILSQICTVIKDQTLSAAKSQILAPVVAKLLMPKYIADNKNDTDKYLKDLGVEGGLSGMNFALSSIMDDGTTIRFTVIYKIKYDIPLIGDYEFSIKQSATCAAWGTEDDSLKNVKINTWSKSVYKRNKIISDNEKATNATIAVSNQDKSGFDLYDSSTNTLTKVTTMDSSILNNALIVDETKFKNELKKELDSLQSNIQSIKTIKMSNGESVEVKDSPHTVLKVYFPEGMAITDTQAQIYANSLSEKYSNITVQIKSYEGS